MYQDVIECTGKMGLGRLHSLIIAFLVAALISACTSPAPKTPSANQNKASDRGASILAIANQQLGARYRYGGNSPKGFDCSGLVYYTHAQLGISVPRTAHNQAQRAAPIAYKNLRKGDLLFFRIYGKRITHVGIYAGGDRFIHAPSSGKRVSYASIDDRYWRKRLVKTGRLY